MVTAMKAVASMGVELTIEERNLVSKDWSGFELLKNCS